MAIVTVVGGANIDIQGFPATRLLPFDSNPGTIRASSGGVGRNIAENLARLGQSVRFVSVFGDDDTGRRLLEELREVGVDTSHCEVVSGRSSSTYLCILDHGGNLHAAVADMGLLEELRPAVIQRHAAALNGIDLCVIDSNLGTASIRRAVELCGVTPCLLDTVSAAKASRARGAAGLFYAVKPNRAELEVLTGIHIDSDADIDQAAQVLQAAGTTLVFVSLGARGLYFSDGGRRGIAELPGARPVNVSGAGDAMTAALALGIAEKLPVDEAAALAVAAAGMTAESESTVDKLMDLSRLRERARVAVIHDRS
ncbi:MAG TPA: carbohydrate kinase family protein [Spirochaetia bacterium]|nr:carbohydrate kinase family protein [Spirochaetia bacterium]